MEFVPVDLEEAGGEYSPESKSLDQLFGKKGPDYLKEVLDYVSKERHTMIELKNPAGATLKIGLLEDTIYSEEPKVVNGWGKFYLPEIVRMQVVGVVEGTSCPSDQLVLITCENRKLFAYDGVELHLVASSLKKLRQKGISYPGHKTYYEGQAFKDMNKEDWEKVRKRPTGKRLKQEHLKLLTENEDTFMEYLKATASIKATMEFVPVDLEESGGEYSPESNAGLLSAQKQRKTDLPYSKTFSPVTMEVCFQLSIKSAGLLFGKKGPDYLKRVLDCVSKENRYKIFELENPAGATLKIGPLEDTIYSEEPKVVNGWGKFYLPEIVRMQVVGVVEGTSCPWDQLVLMICEDGKLYAYDGEELHLVASSMEQLLEKGIVYPGSNTYYEGEAFKDMTEKDWEKVWKSPAAMRQGREHRKEVLERKAKCGP